MLGSKFIMVSSSLLFAMSIINIIQIILQIACDAFCLSGFLLWKEGSGNKDLRLVVPLNFLFQVFVRWLAVLNQVLR